MERMVEIYQEAYDDGVGAALDFLNENPQYHVHKFMN